jgi:hypothetical protein
VIRFAAALLAYRLAEIDYWVARHGGTTDEGTTAAEAHRTRAAAWNAFYELDFSTDRGGLIRLARRAMETALSIRKPDTESEMGDRAYQTREDLTALIAAARNVQPGAEIDAGTKSLLADA